MTNKVIVNCPWKTCTFNAIHHPEEYLREERCAKMSITLVEHEANPTDTCDWCEGIEALICQDYEKHEGEDK